MPSRIALIAVYASMRAGEKVKPSHLPGRAQRRVQGGGQARSAWGTRGGAACMQTGLKLGGAKGTS